MVPVDVMAALDMYVERGQWEKCIQTAEQQVGLFYEKDKLSSCIYILILIRPALLIKPFEVSTYAVLYFTATTFLTNCCIISALLFSLLN